MILSRVKRQNIINKKLESFCNLRRSKLIKNKDLFDRVVDSVEYPNVLFGTFSEKYFDLPDFLLKSVMSEKQDYFCFLKNKSLMNSFAFISSKDKSKKKKLLRGMRTFLGPDLVMQNFLSKRIEKKN